MGLFTNNARNWLGWALGSFVLAGLLGYLLLEGGDKSLFMPGPLSPGHHQLTDNCDTCHTDAFGNGDVLQKACIRCHGDDRVKPFDSHPRSKFTDPRNADLLEKLPATECVTCHREHKQEITLQDGVTQPIDFCVHCHAEIGDDRPSHEDMEFNSCKTAGCHNFHNNRALYTDFLVKHMDDPITRDRPRVPAKEFADVVEELMAYPRDDYPVEPLTPDQADAPVQHGHNAILAAWAQSGHARAGVNCSACHQPRDDTGNRQAWRDQPGLGGCNACHNLEAERFGKGRHGMRLAAGLSPMKPAAAQLPMHDKAAHDELTCNSCHGSHDFDVRFAAVDACLRCHDDEHSQAYEGSPHHELWLAELAGRAPENTGVSCATCHMPRIDMDINDWMSRRVVDHNQSAALSPNSKMIRPACLHCHGLGFAMDSLADRPLIDRNFSGRPQVKVQSIELARLDEERARREKAAARTD